MKSRDLNTIHDIIVTDYKIEPIGEGKFRHSFRPKTTETIYEFEANGASEIEEGEHYNVGYYVDTKGRNIVEPSCLSKNTEINPKLSLIYSRQLSQGKHVINKQKNDERVKHSATDGYYWGKKYAWREFGLVIAKSAFFEYLNELNHAKVPCVTTNPDNPMQTSDSVAFKEEGLAGAVENLIQSAEKVTKVQYKSPLYSKRFTIKGIEAMTDKK